MLRSILPFTRRHLSAAPVHSCRRRPLLRSLMSSLSGLEQAKQQAAYQAVDEWVKDGMKVGIGSGSTVVYAVDRIKQRVKEEKLQVTCVPTSFQAIQLINDGQTKEPGEDGERKAPRGANGRGDREGTGSPCVRLLWILPARFRWPDYVRPDAHACPRPRHRRRR